MVFEDSLSTLCTLLEDATMGFNSITLFSCLYLLQEVKPH